MGVMKIAEWPKYKKTGSPTEKKKRQVQQITTLIFADLFSRCTENGKQQQSTTKLLRAPGRKQRQPTLKP